MFREDGRFSLEGDGLTGLQGGLHQKVQGPAPAGAPPVAARSFARVRVDGKFFRAGEAKFWMKGVTYGPFEPQSAGAPHLPSQHQVEADFRLIAGLGANTVRVYHVPPRSFLDTAQAFGLRVLVDVPWSKHRRFLDNREDREGARRAVREAARTCREHPALFALSVVNEVPTDVARWHGPARVERFVDELVDVARQEDPGALVTFASFPPTEYLHPETIDFHTMNVYLHGRKDFRAYLQRLQNLAGEKPLVLGEYGIDSLRNGQEEQAELLGMHLEEVFGNGLAGTCIFSFTDEWFTGGHAIWDWAFGLVGRDRSPKPAFHHVARVFRSDPRPALPRAPKVSVVVCSYNGSKTLDGCLTSLEKLDYPDYEVILVDDGSKDAVPEIAARHPFVRYHRQPNRGLSVARNVGLELATGEIVAYTDDDCFADEDWLYFLVAKMLETGAEAVGGPNLLPRNDGPVAACVEASPGAPAHILLDDTVAEHVPGCNMAFRAESLRAIGGFDPLYTRAGDDVDVCWRLQERGGRIVFAPAAMVWHHRRATVEAYLKQQRGYGEAEALLEKKHPGRFSGFRADLSWMGRIYTRAGLGLEVGEARVHHGVFGAGLFQTIYSPPQVWWPLLGLSLEWWAAACLMLLVAPFWSPAAALAGAGVLGWWATSPLANPLLLLPVLMLAVTAGLAGRLAGQATPQPHQKRWWSRLLIAAMHVAQPVERGFVRYRTRFAWLGLPEAVEEMRRRWAERSTAMLHREVVELWTEKGAGREELLQRLVELARECGWRARVDHGWSSHDLELGGDRWSTTELSTVTEEHGACRRLTAVRLRARLTPFAFQLVALSLWGLVLGAQAGTAGVLLGGALVLGVQAWLLLCARQSRAAAAAGVLTAAASLHMTPLREPAESETRGRAKAPGLVPDAVASVGTDLS